MRIFLVAAIVLLPTAAQASTPASWEQLNRRVNRACIAMSGLARPQILAHRISYSDAIGVEVRMLRGADNRGRMKLLLCAYNRSSGRTEVQDAASWLGASVRP